MNGALPGSVLVAGPTSDDSFAENIVATLRSAGIKVIFDDSLTQAKYSSRVSTLVSAVGQRLQRDYRSAHERWLIKAAQRHRPELFLAPTQMVSEEVLWEIKRAGVKARVAWWGDPPANMSRQGLLTDQWDVIFLKDGDCAQKFRRIGLNAHTLHEAMNPLWHKPMACQSNDDIVIAGNFYEYRQLLVRRLLAKGVRVQLYGGRLPRWAHPSIRDLHSRRYVVKEEKSRVFGEALACLNSTQIIEGNSLNCRAFEIAGAGGLHLMEYRPVISECFEPGREVLTYDSMEELLSHIERAKRYPREIEMVRAAAASRALAEHTYWHRLKWVFKLARQS